MNSDQSRISQFRDLPHVILKLKEIRIGVCARSVKHLMVLPKVTALPTRSKEMRGMINIRGSVIPLYDLRVMLGLNSFEKDSEETIQLLNEREQDHINWINTLLSCIDNGNEFTLARDPTLCKFGKWYGQYRPNNQSVAFLSLWRSLDRPHRKIHAIANKVLEQAANGHRDRAKSIINETRETDLKEMIQLFDKTKTMLRESTREVAVVLTRNGHELAVAVDEVLCIEKFETIEPVSSMPQLGQCELTPWIGRKSASESVSLLLDCEQMP